MVDDPVSASLWEVATRLGLSPEYETTIVWTTLGGPSRLRDANYFILTGHVDRLEVVVSREAQLRPVDPIPLHALRFEVAVELLSAPFRITSQDFAATDAVRLDSALGLTVETDDLPAVERFLTPNRCGLVNRLRERWPVFELRHDRIVIVERDVATNADATVDTLQLLVGAANAFSTNYFPE